jgi:hypothetical protein
MAKPYVTALIDTYNHAAFIEKAITSVLEQDFTASDMEIIVVDDGSTDATPEIVRKFEPRVRVLRKSNGGQASAFNAGVPETRGEIVCFLDGDDWWAPNKVKRVLETMDAEPDLGLVGHGIIEAYSDGRQVLHAPRESCRFRANTVSGARELRRRKSLLGTSRMTVRVNVLKQVLPVPGVLAIQADEYIFTMAAALSETRTLPEPLVYYRMHESNAFQTSAGDARVVRRKYQVLAEVARTLPPALRRHEIKEEVIRTIVEAIEVESDQIRLMVDGGDRWETIRTEIGIMRILFGDASFAQHLFSLARLAPAVAMSPQNYYRWRQRMSRAPIYQELRRKFFPFPVQPHIRQEERHVQ